jgi:hypothetical protein
MVTGTTTMMGTVTTAVTATARLMGRGVQSEAARHGNNSEGPREQVTEGLREPMIRNRAAQDPAG